MRGKQRTRVSQLSPGRVGVIPESTNVTARAQSHMYGPTGGLSPAMMRPRWELHLPLNHLASDEGEHAAQPWTPQARFSPTGPPSGRRSRGWRVTPRAADLRVIVPGWQKPSVHQNICCDTTVHK